MSFETDLQKVRNEGRGLDWFGFLKLDADICHRSNSAPFLADCIFNVFRHGVLGYDRNLEGHDKEKAELVKLCLKACDRIAKEIV